MPIDPIHCALDAGSAMVFSHFNLRVGRYRFRASGQHVMLGRAHQRIHLQRGSVVEGLRGDLSNRPGCGSSGRL
jgi:hypothetical protein